MTHKGPEFPGLPLDVVVIRMKKRRHLRRGSRCGAGPRPVPERRVVTAVAVPVVTVCPSFYFLLGKSLSTKAPAACIGLLL